VALGSATALVALDLALKSYRDHHINPLEPRHRRALRR
jgi:hypothetical protein